MQDIESNAVVESRLRPNTLSLGWQAEGKEPRLLSWLKVDIIHPALVFISLPFRPIYRKFCKHSFQSGINYTGSFTSYIHAQRTIAFVLISYGPESRHQHTIMPELWRLFAYAPKGLTRFFSTSTRSHCLLVYPQQNKYTNGGKLP